MFGSIVWGKVSKVFPLSLVSVNQMRRKRTQISDIENHVILFLAEYGPVSSYELEKGRPFQAPEGLRLEDIPIHELLEHKGTKIPKASVSKATHELEGMRLIEQIPVLVQEGRRKPKEKFKWWLTGSGVEWAIGLGADVEKLIPLMKDFLLPYFPNEYHSFHAKIGRIHELLTSGKEPR